jgi:hypothetical protein
LLGGGFGLPFLLEFGETLGVIGFGFGFEQDEIGFGLREAVAEIVER